jgi:hypothetical protein
MPRDENPTALFRILILRDSNTFFLSLFFLVGDQRLSGHKKNDHNNFKELTKKEVDVILGYIQLWPQRYVQLVQVAGWLG